MLNKIFDLLDRNNCFVVEVDTGSIDKCGRSRTRMMLEKYDTLGEGERVFDLSKLKYFFRNNLHMRLALEAL